MAERDSFFYALQIPYLDFRAMIKDPASVIFTCQANLRTAQKLLAVFEN